MKKRSYGNESKNRNNGGESTQIKLWQRFKRWLHGIFGRNSDIPMSKQSWNDYISANQHFFDPNRTWIIIDTKPKKDEELKKS